MRSALKSCAVLQCCVVLLFSTVLMAQEAPAGSAKKRSSGAVTAQDVRELRQALAAQQQQIQQMQEEMRRRDELLQQMQQALAQAQTNASTAQEKAATAQSLASEQGESVSKIQGDLADVKMNQTNTAASTQEDQKRVARVEETLGRFRFSGDVRVRYENFFQEGAEARHRERIRLRFGFLGRLNEDFSAGIFLATGALSNGSASLADPVSTNETLTGFFERKAIGVDRGWITYNPQSHKWLELTGGKWAYTWIRTPMTFDSDLNPEGFSEKASFDLNHPVFKNVTFQGMQILFSENSSAGFPGFDDSYAAGFAFNTRMQLGSRVTITPSFSLLDWQNEDTIAQAASPATLPGTVLPVVGGGGGTVTLPTTTATRVINANLMTNATRNCGAVAVPNPECRFGGAAHREFVSGFKYADFIVDTNIKTPWARWPIRLLAEYEKNLDAVNEDPAAVGKQDSAYWLEASIGQTRNKNDFLFGYSFGHMEQDAFISQFGDSDFRAETNVIQHRLYANWKVRNNTTLSYTLFIGRTLDCRLQNAAKPSSVTCNAATPGNLDPWLKRMQFDAVYSF